MYLESNSNYVQLYLECQFFELAVVEGGVYIYSSIHTFTYIQNFAKLL